MGQRKLVEIAERELTSKYRKLIKLVGEIKNNKGTATWGDIQQLLKDIRESQTDTMTAAGLLGRMAPWLPHLQDNPTGTPEASLLELSIRSINDLVSNGRRSEITNADGFRYPSLEKSVKWLTEQRISSPEELTALQDKSKKSVYSAAGLDDYKTLKKLQKFVEKAFSEGLGEEDFRERVERVVAIDVAKAVTVYRTATKAAYVDGMESSLEKPLVGHRLPYVYYTATRDNRTREHHWALDGFVVLRGTTEHEILKAIAKEWNCRCSLIPINESRAKQYGIKTMADIPQIVKDHYHNNLATAI